MIITIDPAATAPIFQQICDQVVAAVRLGRLAPGARLPTVRQLAGDLGVAVNTVAKAYRQLEAEGHVRTRGRNGTVVLGLRDEPVSDESTAAALLFARAAQRSGLGLNEAIGLLRASW